VVELTRSVDPMPHYQNSESVMNKKIRVNAIEPETDANDFDHLYDQLMGELSPHDQAIINGIIADIEDNISTLALVQDRLFCAVMPPSDTVH
jgi:hypothetical protein